MNSLFNANHIFLFKCQDDGQFKAFFESIALRKRRHFSDKKTHKTRKKFVLFIRKTNFENKKQWRNGFKGNKSELNAINLIPQGEESLPLK